DDAGGVTNEAHIHIIPSLLCRGEHPNIVLEYVVNETMTRLGDRVGWSRDKEIKCVTKRIMSAYNNLLLKDHDQATGTIPDWRPGEFHEAWMRIVGQGGRPMLHFNAYGFCIRGAQQNFPHSRAANPEPRNEKADPSPKKSSSQDNAKSENDGAKTNG